MNKLPRILLVFLTLLAVAATSVEAKSKKKKEPPKPRGTIIANVSPESITVTENSITKTFAITQFTEILYKGQRATIAALVPGMMVSVTLGSDPTKAARINASDPPVAHPTK